MVGAVASKKIAPKGNGEIRAMLSPRGYKGRVKKTIYIECNDPVTPTVRLTLIASIASPSPWLSPETRPTY